MKEIVDYLKVYHFEDKIRFGNNFDGGYVIGKLEGNYDCYISAGVSFEESFSRDFINYYKMNKKNSYAFDGTIDKYPVEYTDKITFVKKNINSFFNSKNVNLLFFMRTFKNIFLKMDIEGSEYNWLLNTNENDLRSFKQIAIEFHGINDDSWSATYKEKLECLKKLTKTHYLIHIHGNNYGGKTNDIPDVIEATFVNKNYFLTEPELNKINLPIEGLDYPNYLSVPDYDLSFLNKHNLNNN